MNTTTLTTTRLALGAAIAALCLGAAACGSETSSADPATSIKQAGAQQQSRISPRAAEHQAELEEQARQQRAEHAEAERWARGHETGTSQSSTPHGSQRYPDLHP